MSASSRQTTQSVKNVVLNLVVSRVCSAEENSSKYRLVASRIAAVSSAGDDEAGPDGVDVVVIEVAEAGLDVGVEIGGV